MVLPTSAARAAVPFAARGATTPWRPEVALVCAGLFLASSDRLLTVELGGPTLKPSYVLFGAALGLVLARTTVRSEPVVPAPITGLRPIVGALLVLYLIAAVASPVKGLAAAQMLVIVGGALVPFAAIGFGLLDRIDLERALTAYVGGTLVASVFGLYQLASAQLGLPLPPSLAYVGVVEGGVGRISAWSYEPSFWAFHVEAAIAVALGDALAGRRRFGVRPAVPLVFLIVQLVLVNARAGYVSIPLVVLLVLRANRRARGFDRRALRFVQAGLAVLGVCVVLALTTRSDVVDYAGSRLASVTNTDEAASNAVRLQLYDTAVDLARERPLLGYGPGGAGAELVERVPLYRGLSPFGVPANNVVLQLVLDAGLGTLPIYAALLGLLWWHARKAPDRHTRILLAALLALLLVNGALVSFMWDMRLWVVIGLAYAAARTRLLAGAGAPIPPAPPVVPAPAPPTRVRRAPPAPPGPPT